MADGGRDAICRMEWRSKLARKQQSAMSHMHVSIR